MNTKRGSWGSKLGFILAASGSAIGLGNIVFFSGNAYKYGGGAFYVPYFIALFVIGIPIMMLEFSLGRYTGLSFPLALRRVAGKAVEPIGWFGIFNAALITMYYITILGWVFGCLIGSFHSLWEPSAVPAFGLKTGQLSNSMSFFFNMISHYSTVIFVVIVWVLNMVIVVEGAATIEKAVKFFVPLMWLMMLVLIVRGLTLDNGFQGVLYLFTPDFSVMKDPEVWKGAFSQMFFTLSLGFGIMTTYASYLPKDSDDVSNAGTISFMNCGFEFIAGLAFFSLLFTFSIVPKTSTLSMMFFVVPEGIAHFPVGVVAFGVMFFLLLLFAGLTSAVSLVEAVISSLIDRFGWSRRKTMVGVVLVGILGSTAFAWPTVIDPSLNSDGTFGLSLLDLSDHWAFSYGLLIAGLLECIVLGWVFDLDELRAFINKTARLKLGKWFNVLIRLVIPAIVTMIIISGIIGEISHGLYGTKMSLGSLSWLPWVVLLFWLFISIVLPVLVSKRPYKEPAS